MNNYTTKTNERDTRERLRAFWAGSSLGRPALRVQVKNAAHTDIPWTGDADRRIRELLPEYQLTQFRNSVSRFAFLAESMPGMTIAWANNLVTVATLAGADYGFESGTSWVKPLPDIYERNLPAFSPTHPIVAKLRAIFETVVPAGQGRWFTCPPALLDAPTVLSTLRTPRALCEDLLDRPEDVKRVCRALTELYLATHDHFYRLIEDLGGGRDSRTWLDLMAEGRTETVQCDFSVMLSPDMYREFVLPDLRRVTDYLDYSLYHLDGVEQMRFLDLLRECPKLNGIQWNPQPGVGSPVAWIHAMKEIRKRGFSLYVSCNAGEAVAITRALGPDGLYFAIPPFDTEAEATAAIRDIAAAC